MKYAARRRTGDLYECYDTPHHITEDIIFEVIDGGLDVSSGVALYLTTVLLPMGILCQWSIPESDVLASGEPDSLRMAYDMERPEYLGIETDSIEEAPDAA